MGIKELKQKRAALLAEAKAIQAKADEEKRDLTDEEFDSIKAKMGEAEALAGQIKAAEERAKVLSDLNAQTAAVEARPGRATAPDDAASQTVNTAIRSVVSTHDNLLDDPKRAWANVGQFAAAVYDAGMGQVDERLKIGAVAGTGMEQNLNTTGGYLVPPSFSQSIWDRMSKAADSLVARCDNFTLPYGTESITFPAKDETSRADGSRWGGIRGYWKSELLQMTESRPTFREVKFEPQELYVFVYVSDKLLRNAGILSQYISRAAADEINFKLGDAIINGTGSAMPKGIMVGTAGTSAARIEVAKETSQAADTIVPENIDNMWSRLHPNAQANAVWLYDPSVLPVLQKMSRDVGTGGLPAFMPPGGMSVSPYGTLMGRPMVPCEYCGAVGDAGDLLLVDLSAYGMVTRGGIEEAMSIHLKFDYNQTAFRFIFEADGQPWVISALTPFTPSGGTTKTATLSPFVAIAARA